MHELWRSQTCVVVRDGRATQPIISFSYFAHSREALPEEERKLDNQSGEKLLE